MVWQLGISEWSSVQKTRTTTSTVSHALWRTKEAGGTTSATCPTWTANIWMEPTLRTLTVWIGAPGKATTTRWNTPRWRWNRSICFICKLLWNLTAIELIRCTLYIIIIIIIIIIYLILTMLSCRLIAAVYIIVANTYRLDSVGAVVQLVEYRTRNREVASLTHTRSTASNLEQVANLLCAQANSASYPQRNGKWVVATATGWRPSVADWGDGVSASCTAGPVVR